MKIQDYYKLNNDFDLKGYNIILKKNSVITIKDIFNKNVEDDPTIFSINVDGLNGDFNVTAEQFSIALNNNEVEKIDSKFDVGNCVIYNGENFLIERKAYNDFIDKWYYKLINRKNWIFEEELDFC